MSWASFGVSPSEASRGMDWRCEACTGMDGRGTPRHGLRWQHGGPSGSPCRLHWWTRYGTARHAGAWRVEYWPGAARHGLQTAARRASALPAALLGGLGKARQARVWQGAAGCGAVRPGGPWAADGGTEGFGLPCHPHKGGRARPGTAGRGSVGLGAAWQGSVRQGLTISALSPSGLSAGFFGIQMWCGRARCGLAGLA
jgi:hypothetical protein